MNAIFIELPPFERLRAEYFDDEAFRGLYQELMMSPDFWKDADNQFWLFTVCDKYEADDLTSDQCRRLKQRLESDIAARRTRP